MRLFLSSLVLLSLLFCLPGCTDQTKPKITVLAGRGLKKPMEEIRSAFINKHGFEVHIVYAGSSTLLDTMKKSNRGDVFIPGSLYTLNKAGDMIVRHVPVALHTPVIAISSKNPLKLESLADLAKDKLRLGIAHKEMAALGRTSEEIFAASPHGKKIMSNVIIKAQNVTVLLAHLVNDELDAAIIWSDMLLWPESQGVTFFAIPPQFNKIKKIHAGLLRQSTNPKAASLFVDFMSQQGPAVFQKHGFEAIP
ncbi:MAG: molybdate ABC transporter substrate-binding protein [Thermodesulfobacteriota bacterium]